MPGAHSLNFVVEIVIVEIIVRPLLTEGELSVMVCFTDGTCPDLDRRSPASYYEWAVTHIRSGREGLGTGA